MSLTTDRNDECLNEKKDNGQNQCYLILSEEERAKGFIRPYRDAYVHVGANKTSHWKEIHRMLDAIEDKDDIDKGYVAVMTILYKEDGSFLGGTYVTKKELDAWKKGERIGGCGARTVMNSREICETYARNPKFYGATFCIGCGKHLPVGEFFWDGTTEEVGS